MFAENLPTFFDLDEFGITAVLDGVEVVGIFDNAYDASAIAVGDIAGSIPAFTLPTASVPARPTGKFLVVNGKTYKVVEHRPDGTGVSVLRLEA